MASSKLPPRQKMIGMMYLVLTALLALNVTREILNSFVVVNAGLEATDRNFTRNNALLYTEFDQLKLYDPKRVEQNWEKAQTVRRLTGEVSTLITTLKRQILRETEHYTHKEEDTIHLAFLEGKDNLDVSTRVMIGGEEDGSQGKARELKNKLNDFREKILNLLEPEDRKTIHLSIDTKDPARTEDESSKNWELYNFHQTPTAAAITILSKLEADAKDAESEVVERLLARSSGETIPFDTIAAKVVSESNYVLLGEKYKADVFIAAFNKTLKTDVIAGDYDAASKTFRGTTENVPVAHGMGKYTADASAEGFHKMMGIIRMVSPKGKVFEYPYASEYIVARPSLTVSADSMNVMYAGLANPISVSVPGVPNDKLSVMVTNGKLISKGNGKFAVEEPSAGKAIVRVMAEMGDGAKRPMGEISFRVKNLPKPTAKIGDLTASGKMKGSLLAAQDALLCFYDKFDFKAKPQVLSFEVILTNSSNGLPSPTPVQGYRIPGDLQAKIRKLHHGEYVSFESIKAQGPDHRTITLDPIVIRIE